MRKKLVRTGRAALLQPKPIITFDNPDYNDRLLNPAGGRSRNWNRELVNKHAQLLRLSAAQSNTLCLASNQIAEEYTTIVLHKDVHQAQGEQAGALWISNHYSNPDSYLTYSQPRIIKAQQLVTRFEESISFPFLLFQVNRYNHISVEYKNEEGDAVEEELEGGLAWAFQQSWLQLHGYVVFDWRVNEGRMSFQPEVLSYFSKSAAVVEEYAADLKKVFRDYPELLKTADPLNDWEKRGNEMQEQALPFENDYLRRLMKHYGREMGLLQDRIAKGTLGEPVWERPKKLEVKVIKK
jgi:peptide deformylase